MYVMKFYNELESSELMSYGIPIGAWAPVYLKEPEDPDPIIRTVLELLEIEVLATDCILWARPGDFMKKYIEPYGEPVKFTVFVDRRVYFLSYIELDKYLFGNSDIDFMIFGEDMIIRRYRSGSLYDLTISDFAQLGFPKVKLNLGRGNYYV